MEVLTDVEPSAILVFFREYRFFIDDPDLKSSTQVVKEQIFHDNIKLYNIKICSWIYTCFAVDAGHSGRAHAVTFSIVVITDTAVHAECQTVVAQLCVTDLGLTGDVVHITSAHKTYNII